MKKFPTIVRFLGILSALLISNLVNCQILVSGTSFDPIPGKETNFYIGLADISQIGFQPSVISSTPAIAPNVNTGIFYPSTYYAITPDPSRLDNANKYVSMSTTPDYMYVYAGNASINGGNFLQFSLGGMQPGAAVRVDIDYVNVINTAISCGTGNVASFKVSINKPSNNPGTEVTQVKNGISASVSITDVGAVVDASGNIVVGINPVNNADPCHAIGIKSIKIYSTPLPNIISASGNQVCVGDQITLQTTSTYNGTYQWQVDNGSGTFTNIFGATNQAALYQLSNTAATYKFRCQITPLPSGTAISSNVLTVTSIVCCIDPATLLPTSRKVVYFDDFGTLDLSDVSGKTYKVWDYSVISNPTLVTKTTTTPFRWTLSPAPLGASFQATGPLFDGQYSVAAYLTNGSADNGYAGAQLSWAADIGGLNPQPTVGLDHSGTKAGACLLINCPQGSQGQSIYSKQITGLCTGKELSFECWINVFTMSSNCATYAPVNVTVRLSEVGNPGNVKNILGVTATNQAGGGGAWVPVNSTITLSAGGSLLMEVINNSAAWDCGNDLVIDDIKILACSPPALNLYFDIPTLSTQENVCTSQMDLNLKPSTLLNSFYGGSPQFIYQWSRTPTVLTSWTNLVTPQTGQTFSMANPQLDASFSGVADGGMVYFRAIAATSATFIAKSNFTGANYANDNDPCKNYSVSNVITATLKCPTCAAPTSVTITPATQTLCAGAALTITGTVTFPTTPPTGTYQYTWYKGTYSVANIVSGPSATYSNFTKAAVFAADAGTYRLRVEDYTSPGANSSCYKEASVVVTVNPTLVPSVAIAVSPTGAICAGGSVTFTATPTNGGTTPTYQWKLAGANITGATNATYTTTTAANGDSYTVTLTSNATCASPTTATSTAIVMTVNPVLVPSVAIAVSPTGAICAGASVTFTATPTNGGTTPTYQWKLAGVNITGATNATYTTTTAANGDSYTVTLTSNATCASPTTATSTAIVMTVNPVLVPSVAIAVSPTGAICAGASLTFTATPTNGGTPTYQWKKGGVNIVGETNATYTTTIAANGDSYTVTMTSNALCASPTTATSTAIVTTVNPVLVPSVAIAVAPTGAICAGASVTFTATPTNGGTTPTYQWKKGGVNIASATNATYTTTGAANADSYTVTLTSNATCVSPTTATSSAIVMTVNPILPVSVLIATPSTTICAGTSVTFTATPTNGGTTPTYVWKKNTVVIGGATNSTYSTTAATNGDTYTVVMTSNATCPSGNPATSNAIVMTVTTIVTPAVSITAAPGNTICAGASVMFTASPGNGGSAPTYEWFIGTTSQGAPSTTANKFTSTTLVNGNTVKVIMTSNSGCVVAPGTATSNIITMTVNPVLVPAVAITVSPTGAICPNTSITFTTAPTNGGTPTYVWRKNGVAIAPAATNATFTTTTAANGDSYDVVMTSTATCATPATATSNAIVITVTPTPTPSVSIVADKPVICSGQTVVFTATPVQGGLTPVYVWKNNGLVIAGETTASLSISTLGTPNSITVEMVSNAVCAPATPVASNAIVTTVNAGIGAGTIGNPQTICYNSIPATINQLTAATGVTAAATYTWEASLNGVTGWGVIPGATNTSYTPPVAITADVYVRRVVLDGSLPAPCNTATTPSVRITVRPILVAGVIAADQIICSGVVPATITQTTAPTGGTQTFTYQWQSDAATIGVFVDISGATNSSYTSAAITRTTQFQRTEISGGSCGSITSNIVTKTVTAPETVTAVIDNASAQVCASAASIVFTATGSSTTGTGTLSYQWYLGSVSAANAVGTNSSTYTYAPVSTNDNGKQVNLVVTTSNGCNSGPGTAMPYVLDIVGSITPTISISVNHNPNCAGIPTTFTATSTGGGSGATYQWYLVPFATGTPQGVGTGGTTYTSSALADRDSVYVEMTSSSTCLAGGLSNPFQSNKIRMQIKLIPAPSIVEGDQTVCSPIPGSFTFHGSVTPGNTYQWKLNNVAITGATNADYTATQSGTYTLNEDNGICNSTSAPVVLTVIQTPVANAGADIYMKEGDLGNLNGSGGAVYSWSPSTYLSSAVVSNPNFQATQTITYTLTVSAPSNPLCFTTANVTVFVVKPIKVPNVITVNGDGVNDDWVIENIEGYPNVIIEIYNRWGNLVWKSQGYPKNWDGTNFRNGQVLPDGTYFYIINLQSQVYNEPLTGWVQIIK